MRVRLLWLHATLRRMNDATMQLEEVWLMAYWKRPKADQTLCELMTNCSPTLSHHPDLCRQQWGHGHTHRDSSSHERRKAGTWACAGVGYWRSKHVHKICGIVFLHFGVYLWFLRILTCELRGMERILSASQYVASSHFMRWEHGTFSPSHPGCGNLWSYGH